MRDIKSMTLEELKDEMKAIGEKPFRATQLYDWMHVKLARSFDEMSNLSKELREKCKANYEYTSVKQVQMQESAIDGTRKYLFEMADGSLVESVWMKYKHGNSVCISSQVGCRMGCAFCASTLDGLERSLAPSEMLDQIYAISLHTGERVSNVVVMGTGEPMDNYDNLLRFLELLTKEGGLHISQRNLTVSTCGIVPKIKEFADFDLQINLAISLHAPNDELRSSLMKINKRYSLSEVMEALNYYFIKTNRRVTFEYILLQGINDSKEHAKELVRLIKQTDEVGKCCYVNLIPYNEVSTKPFKRTSHEQAEAFFKVLHDNNIQATLRMEHGSDISAACGQLRAKKERING